MEGMVKNSNPMITAWHGKVLIGVARSMTDFHYACYLSDIAVLKRYQRRGIGKELQIITQAQLGPHCNLILLAGQPPTPITSILVLQTIKDIGFLLVKKTSTASQALQPGAQPLRGFASAEFGR